MELEGEWGRGEGEAMEEIYRKKGRGEREEERQRERKGQWMRIRGRSEGG